jgi:hypothetical protein
MEVQRHPAVRKVLEGMSDWGWHKVLTTDVRDHLKGG